MVILGRGANLILPHDKCLRVRITASFSTRVDNTYKYESKASKEAAREWVRQVEHQRNQFIRQYFGSNPHNPWNYDLVISTDHLSLDQAVEVILHAYTTKFPKEAKRLKSRIS
jgi:cytidylate kinase